MATTRILVIDDEEVVRSAVSSLLNEEGHETITAKNGEEAIAEAIRAYLSY